MKGISPNFGHKCIWFVDMLIRYWGQKVKGQGHSRQWLKTLWTPYLTTQWRKFHPILVTDVFRS